MNRDAQKVAHGSLRVFFAALVAACLVGCSSTYKGGNIHDGTHLVAGIKPAANSQINISALDYLNGWVLSWESADSVKATRKVKEHLSFCGIVETSTESETEIDLTPTVQPLADTGGGEVEER